MSFTAEDLDKVLKDNSSNIVYNGYSDDDEWEWWEFWHEACVGNTLEIPGIGTATVVEAEVGKAGTVVVADGYNVWENWIILEIDGRFFRQPGEYDSWDAKGDIGPFVEVQKVEKTIEVWEEV